MTNEMKERKNNKMKKCKCNDCGKKFEQPKIVKTTYETFYGVSGDFPNTNTSLTLFQCPHCESENYEENYEAQ